VKALLLAILIPVSAVAQTATVAPADAPARVVVPPQGEPGTPIVISGVVTDANGAPLRNASVYVYQTDAKGYYRPDDAMGNKNPRLMALLRTDAAGRYSFRTIRPGSYPGTRVPQHIHYEVAASGQGSRIFEIIFAQDPNVTAEIRKQAVEPGSIYSLRRIEPGASGVGLVTQDVVLER